MIVQTHNFNFSNKTYKPNIQNKYTCKNSKINTNQISFKGHIRVEKLKNAKMKWLRHDTAFFRDIQTKEFVKSYIEKHFAHKEKINIIVGACSTGEEVYTYSMILKHLKEKIRILGFDISPNSVEEAKSGKFLMQRRAIEKGKKETTETTAGFLDSFLCFQPEKALTQSQLEQKKLFDEFLEISPEAPQKQKISLLDQFFELIFKKMSKESRPEYEEKYVTLKKGKIENCEFVQGDIMKLNEIIPNEKADVFTFANAIYHLITDPRLMAEADLKKNASEITKEIAKQIKEHLNPNGILVLGEYESSQVSNPEIVPKALTEMGFKPLNKTNQHIANVWKLA